MTEGRAQLPIISALHKSVRNSDPDAASTGWEGMLEAGEEPDVLCAADCADGGEIVGAGGPERWNLCFGGEGTHAFLGHPEGELALAQAVVIWRWPEVETRFIRLMGRCWRILKRPPRARAAASAERSDES